MSAFCNVKVNLLISYSKQIGHSYGSRICFFMTVEATGFVVIGGFLEGAASREAEPVVAGGSEAEPVVELTLRGPA